MPAEISKNPDGTYRVETPNGVHAKKTTKVNAIKQRRLLDAIDHGWRPTGKPNANPAPAGPGGLMNLGK